MNKQEMIKKLIKWWHTLKRDLATSKNIEEENYVSGEMDMINMILSKMYNIDVIKTKEVNYE